MFGNCFLIFTGLDESESERVVSLDEIGIDLDSFLEMLGGGVDIAGLKGFSGALEFFQGFGWDAELADWDSICRWWCGCAIRFRARVKKGERVPGIKVSAKLGCA